jgi:hypothetical protein
MCIGTRYSVDDLSMAKEFFDEARDLFWGLLEIIIHGHDHRMPGQADPCERRIVLPVVPH